MKRFFLMSYAGMILAAMFLFSTALYAVDTTEPFSRGILTDFEAYYTSAYDHDGRGHGLEFLAGGGFTDTLSYGVTLEVANRGDASEIGAVGLGLIWTVLEQDTFALDILPAFSFDATESSGEMSYPGSDAFTTGLDLEFNLTVIKAIQPYFLAGFSFCKADCKHSWLVPLALGSMVPLSDKVEFLAQLNWIPSEESAWSDSERCLSLGLNIKATENLEIITGIAEEFDTREFSVSAGLIYAL